MCVGGGGGGGGGSGIHSIHSFLNTCFNWEIEQLYGLLLVIVGQIAESSLCQVHAFKNCCCFAHWLLWIPF